MSADVLDFRCEFRYGQSFRLDAAFALPPGISALYGPSGSGKTTCLALIAGLLRPHAGTIRLGDDALVDCAARRWTPPQARGIGLVFQEHLLFPHKSVRANLRYGMRRRVEGAIRFEQVVDVLEVGDLLDRSPAQLSGGQQRRVALGRAVLSTPRLLLLDEPLTGLDATIGDRVLHYLRQVHEQWQVPMLLVSHDQTVVRRMASHVVLLESGRCVAQGSAHAVLDDAPTEPPSNALAPMNLLRVEQITRTGDHSVGSVGGQRLHLPSGVPPDRHTLHIRCLARDVVIVVANGVEKSPLSGMRNHLHGTIRDIVPGAPTRPALVAIDVGQIVWAELADSACRELRLVIGMPVVCAFRVTAPDIVP